MSELKETGKLAPEPRVRYTVRLLQSEKDKYSEVAALLGGDLSKLIRTSLEEYANNHAAEIEAKKAETKSTEE